MNFGTWTRSQFTIAPESLRAFRVALGCLVLVDVIQRLPLSDVLLTRNGVLRTHPEEYWGLLALVDAPVLLYLVMLGAALAGVSLCLGSLLRSSSFILWVCVSSIHARNPWYLDGGDGCLRWLVLWNLLLAFEAPADNAEGESDAIVPSVSGAGLLVQPAIIYISSVAHKLKGSSWRNGTAVFDALSQSLWERPLGIWIVEHPPAAFVANYATLLVEAVAPLLLFSPFRSRACRFLGLSLLVGLQLGIGLSLRMNLFPFIMTAALIPLLPGDVWSRVKLRLPRRPASGVRPFAWARQLSLAIALQSVLGVTNSVLGGRLLPGSVERIQAALGLDQAWSMYSPNPYAYDFGIEIVAHTTRGEERLIDAGRGAHPYPPLAALWRDYRGGMYLEGCASPKWPEELHDFATWLAESWAGHRGEELLRIEMTLLEWDQVKEPRIYRTPLLDWRAGERNQASK